MPNVTWFDGIVLVLLAVGAVRGWINGPGWEFPRLLMWLSIALFSWLLANPVADLGRRLGLDPVIARYAVFALVATVVLWTFLALLKGAVERLGPMVEGGRALRAVGLLLGSARYASLVLILLGLLAILPGSTSRLGEIRRHILTGSFAGELGRAYWFPLSPELDAIRGQQSTG